MEMEKDKDGALVFRFEIALHIFNNSIEITSGPVRHIDGPLEVPPIAPSIITTVLRCFRWHEKIGKKPANSCKGCTVTCPAKGKYNGEPMEIKS